MLCKQNPAKRCGGNFAGKYWVGDRLAAKCEAEINVEVHDTQRGDKGERINVDGIKIQARATTCHAMLRTRLGSAWGCVICEQGARGVRVMHTGMYHPGTPLPVCMNAHAVRICERGAAGCGPQARAALLPWTWGCAGTCSRAADLCQATDVIAMRAPPVAMTSVAWFRSAARLHVPAQPHVQGRRWPAGPLPPPGHARTRHVGAEGLTPR